MPKTSDDVRQKRDEQRIEGIKKSSKMNNKARIIICCVVGALLLGIVVTVSFVGFKVKNIDIQGDSVYSHEKITETVGYLMDTGLLTVDKQKAADTITSTLPYIKSVDVSIKLPSTVVLEIHSNTAAFAVRVSDGYVLADENFKCIDKQPKTDAHPVFYGVELKSAKPGSTVEFSDSNRDKIVHDIMSAIQKEGADGITQINLNDEYNIQMIYSARHIWKVGDSVNMEYKIRYGKALSEREEGTGTVNLSMLEDGNNKAYFVSEVIKPTFEKETEKPASQSKPEESSQPSSETQENEDQEQSESEEEGDSEYTEDENYDYDDEE